MKSKPWDLLGALLVLLLGTALLLYTLQWVLRAERVTGTAGHTTWSSAYTRIPGAPMVQVTFATKTGEVRKQRFKSFSKDSYPEGSAVPIIYNPANPSSASLNTFLDLWLLPLAVYSWGAVWHAVWLRKHRRLKAASAVE